MEATHLHQCPHLFNSYATWRDMQLPASFISQWVDKQALRMQIYCELDEHPRYNHMPPLAHICYSILKQKRMWCVHAVQCMFLIHFLFKMNGYPLCSYLPLPVYTLYFNLIHDGWNPPLFPLTKFLCEVEGYASTFSDRALAVSDSIPLLIGWAS